MYDFNVYAESFEIVFKTYEDFLNNIKIENSIWTFLNREIESIDFQYHSAGFEDYYGISDVKDGIICAELYFWRGKISKKGTFTEPQNDKWHEKELREMIKKIQFDYDFNKLLKGE